jgi:hypothetical protein
LRVGDDLFYGCGGAGCGGSGQVEAGDLQAVEEQAGAFGVDFVAGDAAEDFADGELDGGAVFGEWEVELGLAVAALAWVFDGAAGGVVVVTELFVAEAWAAAAMAVGEDVAALIALGFGLCGVWCGVLHVYPLSLLVSPKVFKRKGLHPDFGADPG